MILFIDTSKVDTVTVAIETEGGRFEKTTQSKILKSQMVLPLIEELLHTHHLALTHLTGIEVEMGPGSFTGLRVGIAVANSLSVLLGIPVNGKRTLANARYEP